MREIKTPEDILVRAKNILKRHNNDASSIVKVQDIVEQVFLKVVFSFHPTRQQPDNPTYPILIGRCRGFQTFFVNSLSLFEGSIPDEDDAISVKKCLNGIGQAYTDKLKDFAESKYQSTPLKKLGIYLTKLMTLYPFAQASILQNLIEKLPHKNMPAEYQCLYYKLVLEIAK